MFLAIEPFFFRSGYQPAIVHNRGRRVSVVSIDSQDVQTHSYRLADTSIELQQLSGILVEVGRDRKLLVRCRRRRLLRNALLHFEQLGVDEKAEPEALQEVEDHAFLAVEKT